MLHTNKAPSQGAAPPPRRPVCRVYIEASFDLVSEAEDLAVAIEARCDGVSVVSSWHEPPLRATFICQAEYEAETAHVVVALRTGPAARAVAYALREGVCLLWVGAACDTAPEGERVIAIRPVGSETTEVVVRWLDWILETGRALAEASGTWSPDSVPLCVPTQKLLSVARERGAQAQ